MHRRNRCAYELLGHLTVPSCWMENAVPSRIARRDAVEMMMLHTLLTMWSHNNSLRHQDTKALVAKPVVVVPAWWVTAGARTIEAAPERTSMVSATSQLQCRGPFTWIMWHACPIRHETLSLSHVWPYLHTTACGMWVCAPHDSRFVNLGKERMHFGNLNVIALRRPRQRKYVAGVNGFSERKKIPMKGNDKYQFGMDLNPGGVHLILINLMSVLLTWVPTLRHNISYSLDISALNMPGKPSICLQLLSLHKDVNQPSNAWLKE